MALATVVQMRHEAVHAIAFVQSAERYCLLEVSGARKAGEPSSSVLWLQVRDVVAELRRLAVHGVIALRDARTEPSE